MDKDALFKRQQPDPVLEVELKNDPRAWRKRPVPTHLCGDCGAIYSHNPAGPTWILVYDPPHRCDNGDVSCRRLASLSLGDVYEIVAVCVKSELRAFGIIPAESPEGYH